MTAKLTAMVILSAAGMQSASKRLFEQAQPLRTGFDGFPQKIRAA